VLLALSAYVTVPASVPVAGETIESTDDFGGLFAKYAALTRLIYRVTGDTARRRNSRVPALQFSRLMATMRLRRGSRALQTSPIPPAPMGARNS